MPKEGGPLVTGKKQKIVIIGGGMTGITSAFYLQDKIKKHQLPIEVKLIEASRSLGGKIQTINKDDFLIERGPSSFLEGKKGITKLIEKVGLKDQLIRSEREKLYVISNEKLYSIPEGAMIGIPTQLKPFIFTGLFSFFGKLRASADLIIPRSKEKSDISIGEFFRRRFGDEVVENLIEPLLSGIYAGDIDELSLKSIFPQFYDAEKKYRSIILGSKNTTLYSGENVSDRFLTLRNGLQSLVETIEEKLDADIVLKGHRVEKIEKSFNGGYEVLLNNGESLFADSVISALPHYLLPNLFSEYPFFEPLNNIPATSVATVAMAFSKNAVRNTLEGTGFVVARNSDYTINSCTFTHKKWPDFTPDGKVLFHSYIGRAGDETVVDLSDAEIEQIVLADLHKLMEITEKPDFTIVSRWKKAMPQYTIGHKERTRQLKKEVNKSLPGIFIVGSSFDGIGLPDCIDQGESVVEDVLHFLNLKGDNKIS